MVLMVNRREKSAKCAGVNAKERKEFRVQGGVQEVKVLPEFRQPIRLAGLGYTCFCR